MNIRLTFVVFLVIDFLYYLYQNEKENTNNIFAKYHMVIEMSAKIIAKKGRGSAMAANKRSFTESRARNGVSPHAL